MGTFLEDCDDRNDYGRLSQKSSLLFQLKREDIRHGRCWRRKKKCSRRERAISEKEKVRSIKFWTRCCVFVDWKNWENKQIASHEVRSPIKIRHYVRFVYETRAKNSFVRPRNIADDHALPLFFGRSRRLYDWKPPIVSFVLIVWTDWGDWKPGLKQNDMQYNS